MGGKQWLRFDGFPCRDASKQHPGGIYTSHFRLLVKEPFTVQDIILENLTTYSEIVNYCACSSFLFEHDNGVALVTVGNRSLQFHNMFWKSFINAPIAVKWYWNEKLRKNTWL